MILLNTVAYVTVFALQSLLKDGKLEKQAILPFLAKSIRTRLRQNSYDVQIEKVFDSHCQSLGASFQLKYF